MNEEAAPAVQQNHRGCLVSARIIRGNALYLPLADDSVDLVVTSPPYFGLRSYQDGGEHYDGQIGAEATPAEFVDALVAATAEMVRVTKPCGSIFVNLGDKYAGSDGTKGGTASSTLQNPRANGLARDFGAETFDGSGGKSRKPVTDVRAKSLIGVPWRYALRCIDDLGLILRAEIIWSKPNGLPESVTDRVRRSHETWFHFTLSPRYFSAVDEIREPHVGKPADGAVFGGRRAGNTPRTSLGNTYDQQNPLGKLPGSVWTIPTEPLHVPDHLGIDHFAAFPTEWPRRIIQGWSPSGICTACGEGRAPVRASEKVTSRPGYNVQDQRMPGRHASGNQGREGSAGDFIVSIIGEACACPEPTAPTRPATVLDPFGGTGTTALVADALGRNGITVDMSADYCRLATWRTNDPKQRAKAARREFREPTKHVEGQEPLFLDPTTDTPRLGGQHG